MGLNPSGWIFVHGELWRAMLAFAPEETDPRDGETLHDWPDQLPATKAHFRQGKTPPPAQGATMPKATSCKLYGQIISIDEALHLRDEASRRRRPYPPFRCRECDEFVRPQERHDGPGGALRAPREQPRLSSGSVGALLPSS